MTKQENEGTYTQNLNMHNTADIKEKSIYPNANNNNSSNFQQEANSTYDNFNQNLLNLNMMSHPNLLNDNLQMAMASKNLQMNNMNNTFNQIKSNNLLHMMMSNPNLSAQQAMNISNFSRAGKSYFYYRIYLLYQCDCTLIKHIK